MDLNPPTEHQLLVFWVALLLILVAARLLGVLMQRIGQPAVIGELAAGLLLGPSVLGKVAPDIVGEDIDGTPMKLSDYRGKVVVIDFWGDW